MYVYSDDERVLSDQSSKVVMSSNHRTRIDWMFIIWIYGAVIGKVAGE